MGDKKPSLEQLTADVQGLKIRLDEYDSVFGSPEKTKEITDYVINEMTRPLRISLVVFSGDYDRVLPAFIIANEAKEHALDIDREIDVNMYFTFWGLKVLQKEEKIPEGTNILNKALHWLVPGGPNYASLSRLNYGGLGKKIIHRLMDNNGIPRLEDQMKLAVENGVNIQACSMARGLFGMDSYEDFDNEIVGDYCGVITYMSDALQSDLNLFF